jgi:thiol-disulfide isomerase/thioredoxin
MKEEVSIQKKVIDDLTINDFFELLKLNNGIILIKMGAPWCKPCQKIKHLVDGFFLLSPKNVICVDLNIDESLDLYSFLKNKKMVNGIPVILCYKKGNSTFIPDDSVIGADPIHLDAFFKRCVLYSQNFK